MLVEIGNARDRPDHVGRLVHDDDGGGAEAGAQLAEAVEIHRRIDDLLGRHHAHRRAARNDRQEIVPAAADAAAMRSISSRNGMPIASSTLQGFHVAGNAKELGADIVGPAEGREPGRAATQDVRRHRDRFDVVDGGRAAIETDIRRERRLQPGLTLFALQAFQQRCFLAADVGAGAMMT